MLYLSILLLLVLEFIFSHLPTTMQQFITAFLIGNRHTIKDNACAIEGGTTLTSFKNIVNMRTPISVTWKTQQSP
jgi:hypothetical protein